MIQRQRGMRTVRREPIEHRESEDHQDGQHRPAPVEEQVFDEAAKVEEVQDRRYDRDREDRHDSER